MLPMARCNSCNGVITKTDATCFVCGEAIPGAKRGFFFLRLRIKSVSSKSEMPLRERLDWLHARTPSNQHYSGV